MTKAQMSVSYFLTSKFLLFIFIVNLDGKNLMNYIDLIFINIILHYINRDSKGFIIAMRFDSSDYIHGNQNYIVPAKPTSLVFRVFLYNTNCKSMVEKLSGQLDIQVNYQEWKQTRSFIKKVNSFDLMKIFSTQFCQQVQIVKSDSCGPFTWVFIT